MNGVIFTGFGIDIIKRGDEYFIRYDAGTIAMIEREAKNYIRRSIESTKK
ncbi:TPA: hypothetical protein ONC26_004787 [Enterobacter roggenkampii]|nr:hypothetical protein [Enterobacter roggenkampii]